MDSIGWDRVEQVAASGAPAVLDVLSLVEGRLRTRYTSFSVIMGQGGQGIPARLISMRGRVHTPAAYRLGLANRSAWRALR